MAPGAQNQQQPTKYFSGNGVSVAAMCADLHQYRPVTANEGGHIRSVVAPGKEPLGRLMGDSRGL